MNELKIFNYENNAVRTTLKNGEIWWVLKDVCDVLHLSNSRRVAERLDDDEKSNVTQSDFRNYDFEVPRSMNLDYTKSFCVQINPRRRNLCAG